FKFYERYGVQEYYIYDTDVVELTGFERIGDELKSIPEMGGWISPRLGIRFDLSGSELTIYGPDGERFLTYQEVAEQRDQAARERDQAARERDQAARERDRLAQERDRLAQERDQERQRVERMAAQLRAMGLEPPT